MLKFEEVKSVVKDNEVVINGHSIGKVTDDEAKYIISLIQGKVSPNKPVATSTTTYKTFKTNYKVVKTGSLYRIYSDTYAKCYGHRIANQHIKALSGILEESVEMESGKSYKIWGFKTKKAAEKALETLPATISAEEQELMAAKSKRG